MKTYEEVLQIKNEFEKEALARYNANAIGIGLEKNPDNTEEYIIKLYVNPGRSKDIELSIVQDVRVEVIEEAPLSLDVLYLPDTKDTKDTKADYGRYRPLVAGIQLYLHNNSSAWLGTAGFYVKSKKTTDSNLYLLSNLHVLSSVGLGVFQPYSGEKNLIGATSYAKEFDNSDAALALVDDESNVSLNVVQDIGTITSLQKITWDVLTKRVLKRGRTTLLTEGTIEAIHTTITLTGGETVKDCVIVRADEGKLFSSSGDSGSPVILLDDKKLIGLHFAGNKVLGGISVFCTAENVFHNLNIMIPSE